MPIKINNTTVPSSNYINYNDTKIAKVSYLRTWGIQEGYCPGHSGPVTIYQVWPNHYPTNGTFDIQLPGTKGLYWDGPITTEIKKYTSSTEVVEDSDLRILKDFKDKTLGWFSPVSEDQVFKYKLENPDSILKLRKVKFDITYNDGDFTGTRRFTDTITLKNNGTNNFKITDSIDYYDSEWYWKYDDTVYFTAKITESGYLRIEIDNERGFHVYSLFGAIGHTAITISNLRVYIVEDLSYTQTVGRDVTYLYINYYGKGVGSSLPGEAIINYYIPVWEFQGSLAQPYFTCWADRGTTDYRALVGFTVQNRDYVPVDLSVVMSLHDVSGRTIASTSHNGRLQPRKESTTDNIELNGTPTYGAAYKAKFVCKFTYTLMDGTKKTSSITKEVTIQSSGGGGGDVCLKKDTLITMADGSQKFIQDVKIGDEILGYNFETNTTTPAMAMIMNKTKRHQTGIYVIFSNETTLCLTHGHNLYSVEYGRYLPIEGFEEGDHVLDEQGNEVEIMAIHWDVEFATYNDFYHLVSSNNTYFANGIMNAGAPIDKYRYIHDLCGLPMPQTIQNLIFDESKDAGCFNFTVTDPNFIAEGTPFQYNIKKSSNKIDRLERAIKATESAASKVAAGLGLDISVLKERANQYTEIDTLKQKISDWENEYNKLLVKYSNLGEDILLSDKDRRQKYFKRACKIANDNYETYKYYYTPESIDEETGGVFLRLVDDPDWQPNK